MGKIKDWISTLPGPFESALSNPAPGSDTSNQAITCSEEGGKPAVSTSDQTNAMSNSSSYKTKPSALPFYYPKDDPKSAGGTLQSQEETVVEVEDCFDCKMTAVGTAVVTSALMVKLLVLNEPVLKWKKYVQAQKLVLKGIGIVTPAMLLSLAVCRYYNWGPFTLDKIRILHEEKEAIKQKLLPQNVKITHPQDSRE